MSEIITNRGLRFAQPPSNSGPRRLLLPPKLAITIDLDHLRARMAEFVAEVAPHDPTAYTIPFETYLQWEQRQRREAGQLMGRSDLMKENINGKRTN